MACACQSKREQFEVITKGGEGKTVFTSGSQPTAKTVASRYPGSVVRSKKTGDIVHREPDPSAKKETDAFDVRLT